MNVTVWNEYVHETENDEIKKIYPDGIHGAIGKYLKKCGFDVKSATLRSPCHGLSDEVLENTDVLIWWAHQCHKEVDDETVKKIKNRVLGGMGMIFLHSAHVSKPFKSLMGTTGALRWRESGDREILWAVNENHPLLDGIENPIIIEEEEMYGESFDIPTPDELVLISNFSGGEVFRSCCVWQRGRGKVIYIRPGHETYPIYHNKNILKLIENSVKYAMPRSAVALPTCQNTEPV